MSPSPTASSALPPLPDLSTTSQGQSSDNGGMAAIMSGIAETKTDVDQIITAAKRIVQSGRVPGAEQPCGQIVSLAVSLLPMAAQQALQPQGGGQGGPIPAVGQM